MNATRQEWRVTRRGRREVGWAADAAKFTAHCSTFSTTAHAYVAKNAADVADVADADAEIDLALLAEQAVGAKA